MSRISVKDIGIHFLKRIKVEEGDILHGLKSTDIGFNKFNEAYFSLIKKGSIKAWKKHNNVTMNIIVPFGKVKFYFIDIEGGKRNEIIGENSYYRITVPPGIWFGFKGLHSPNSIILNIINFLHNPEETDNKPINYFKVDWKQ